MRPLPSDKVKGELAGNPSPNVRLGIAVIAMGVPQENQIYHWGVKKKVALSGGVWTETVGIPGGSSTTSNVSISNLDQKSNQNQEYSRNTFQDEYGNDIS